MKQLLFLVSLTLRMLAPGLCSPTGGCSMDDVISPSCILSLSDYYTQVTELPSHLNERSLAAWTYVERIDLDRVPQIIHEAVCLNKHSCNGVDGSLSVESIPISVKIPVLKRNPGCQHHSMEFEAHTHRCDFRFTGTKRPCALFQHDDTPVPEAPELHEDMVCYCRSETTLVLLKSLDFIPY